MGQQETSGKRNEITFAAVNMFWRLHYVITDLRPLVIHMRKEADELQPYQITLAGSQCLLHNLIPASFLSEQSQNTGLQICRTDELL